MTADTDTHRRMLARSLRLTADALGSLGLVLLLLLAVTLSAAGVGLPMLAAGLRWQRRLAQVQRIRAADTLGVPVPSSYRLVPEVGWFAQLRALLTDRATARDALWALVDSTAGFGLAFAPATLWACAAWQFVLPGVVWALVPVTRREVNWLGIPGLDGQHAAGYVVAPLVGIGLAALAWRGTRPLVLTHARMARRLLGAPTSAVLARRVDDLTRTRADSLDLHSAEIRRIERDLHDGAQARLVALGMSLGLAEKLLADRPEARSLLAEARQNNLRALAELRDLVHGIHPPVLADRGLPGAVQALALDTPLPVEVDVQLTGRPPAPAESAAYFAVAECLTNTGKHIAAASAAGDVRVAVRIRHVDGRLRISVHDNGPGGADPGAGTGLRGVARRLAAFDGTMNVSSPPGGPTTISMELPCALS